jgi:hypothetical protein
MTKSLERAIAEAKKLPSDQQEALAAIILEEIQDEEQWDHSFARSQSQLSRLAEKARQDIQAGRVSDLGIDEL